MNRFHVSLGWRTDAGTLRTDGLLIIADDEEQATRRAVRQITTDKRRRFASDMKARALMLPEEPAQ